MKILELQLDGLYMFKENTFQFYTERKSKNSYKECETEISKIFPKNINIIIGSNASGKTTLSKAIFFIERILTGKLIEETEFRAIKEKLEIKIKYLKNKDQQTDYLFEYNLLIDNGKVNESLNYQEFNNKNTISATFQKNKNKLKKIDNLIPISKEEFAFELQNGFQSKIMNQKNNDLILNASNIGYWFGHTNYSDNTNVNFPKERIPINILQSFLKLIDNSIEKVEYTQNDKNDFYIYFKKDTNTLIENEKLEDLLVDHSNLSSSSKRLSYGTVEAIVFFFKVYNILHGSYNTIYIDEELTHLHSELEKIMLINMIIHLPQNSQLFFTTHNLELLKIDLPVSCYTILKEDINGNTKNIHVENHIKGKNDRNEIYSLIKNNYFESEKYFEEMFDIFDKIGDLNEK